MVRKAETVPWVRTGSITRAEVNINLSAEWGSVVVRESHRDIVIGGHGSNLSLWHKEHAKGKECP